MPFGTFSVLDSLATFRGTVAEFGEDRAFESITAGLAAHNRIMADLLDTLVDRTTDSRRVFGGGGDMAMQELDEYGDPNPQKVTTGLTVGFPLRKYGIALQWTRTALQVMRAQEMAGNINDAMTADAKAIQREIKRAIYRPTNLSFVDRLVDNTTIPVFALVNADGNTIPLGPNGEVFSGATHTHYLGTTAFVAADLTALIETVIEHHNQGDPMVFINRAQEAAIRGFAGFVAYLDNRIIGANNVNQANGTLDPTNVNDRAIGVYNGAEVWVKPWAIPGYVTAMNIGGPKPLVMRTRNAGGGDLALIYEDETHPLRARSWEREMGVGVWIRTSAAVLFTGGASYVSPTL